MKNIKTEKKIRYELFIILLAIVIITRFLHQYAWWLQIDKEGEFSYNFRILHKQYQKGSNVIYNTQHFRIIFPEKELENTRVDTGDMIQARVYVSKQDRVLTQHSNDKKVLIIQSYTKKEARGDSGLYPFVKIASLLEVFGEISSAKLHAVLPDQHAVLANGMLFGNSTGFSSVFYKELVSTGMLHVVAASGYNLYLVVGAIESFLYRVRSRPFRLFFCSASIVSYAFLAGFSPSIVRSAFMVILQQVSLYLGRQYSSGFSLLLSAGAMLFIDPLLLFSISFQLTVFALLGLIWFYPVMTYVLFGNRTKTGLLKETLFLSIATNVAITPILLLHFNTYSYISPFVNLLLSFLIAPIMMFSAMLILFSPVSSFLPFFWQIFSFFLWFLLELFIQGIHVFSKVKPLEFRAEDTLRFALFWIFMVLLTFYLSKKWKHRDLILQEKISLE